MHLFPRPRKRVNLNGGRHGDRTEDVIEYVAPSQETFIVGSSEDSGCEMKKRERDESDRASKCTIIVKG